MEDIWEVTEGERCHLTMHLCVLVSSVKMVEVGIKKYVGEVTRIFFLVVSKFPCVLESSSPLEDQFSVFCGRDKII